MTQDIIVGDSRAGLAQLQPESVQCCVTSPLDADPIQLFSSLVHRLHSVADILRPTRSTSICKSSPVGVEIGQRDHPRPPHTNTRNRSLSTCLKHDRRLGAGEFAELSRRKHRLAVNDLRDRPFPTLAHDRPQRQRVLCLCPLDSEVRQQSSQRTTGGGAVDMPGVEGTTSLGVGLLNTKRSAKCFVQQTNRLRLNLLHVKTLGVDGLSRISPDTHRVGAPLDAYTPVGVNDSRQIRHNNRVVHC